MRDLSHIKNVHWIISHFKFQILYKWEFYFVFGISQIVNCTISEIVPLFISSHRAPLFPQQHLSKRCKQTPKPLCIQGIMFCWASKVLVAASITACSAKAPPLAYIWSMKTGSCIDPMYRGYVCRAFSYLITGPERSPCFGPGHTGKLLRGYKQA